MRYGRRRRGFPWRRVTAVGLAVAGAFALLLAAVNWRSAVGLYRINRVSAAVQRLEGVIEFNPAGLRARGLTSQSAATQLERGLADLGLKSRLTVRR
ncbi:MAG: hypothetical protein QME79_01315 [Bacillota bacterium]|nr:hypothetical protein [Bacillota bacterium]